MQRLMPAAFLLLLLPLLPGPALSADPLSAPSPEAVFRFFDANGDGKLSQVEFLKLAERNARLKDAMYLCEDAGRSSCGT